jgi:WD40 repeat protein
VVLAIDQFEEAFTLCRDEGEREQFFACLLGIVGNPPKPPLARGASSGFPCFEGNRKGISLDSSSCSPFLKGWGGFSRNDGENQVTSKLCIIVAMRADFFGKCLEREYSGLAQQIQQHLVTVAPMTQEELRQAIVEPAKRVELAVEPELVTQMLADVVGSPGSLPLLQYALLELWQRRGDKGLRLASYTQLGGVMGTLQKRATAVYEQFSEEEKAAAKHIFLSLTQLGEGTEDTRRRVLKQDLVTSRHWEGLIDAVVQKLADARLIVTQEESPLNPKSKIQNPKSIVVDVAHEALIRHWLLLRQWLAADRDFRLWRERLRHTLRQWDTSDRDEGALFRGALLLEACRWREERPDDLTLQERQFIEASLALQQRERLGRARLRRRVRWGLAGGLAGALVLVGVAMWQWQRAETGAIRDRLNSRISSAEKLLASDKLEALIESIRAARQLQQSRQIDPDIRMRAIAVLQQAVYDVREFNRLEGHDRSILAVSFSPDGQLLVSGSDDKTVKLWHRDGRLIETLTNHQERVRSVSFSPDEQRFASASYDGTVKVWRRDGTLLTTLDGHQGEVNRVSFSPDSQLLASAGADRTVKLWHPDGSLVKTLQGHRSWVTDVRFSPDGQILASSSTDRTIKLWHREGRLLATLNGHQGAVNGLSFSADSQTLASASTDRTVKLWRRDGSLMKTLTGHRDRVWDVSFSPDGQTLASASADKTVKLWRPDGTLLATLQGHHASIYNISFSPDGQTIASASADESIRLWHRHRRQPDRLRGHEAAIGSIRYSPDGQTIASTSADGTVKLWSLQGTVQATIVGHQEQVNQVSFSPDGQLLATASGDETIKLWHADGRLRNTLRGHQADVLGVSFSPDRKILASASTDGTVKLWSYHGKLLKTLKGHTNRVNRVSFSPEGQTLVSASEDGTVKLWSRSGTLLKTLVADEAGVVDVRFSPDGQMIAAASRGTVVLWNANLEALLTMSCTWMQDYLETNKTLPSSDRRLCYGEYKADDFR